MFANHVHIRTSDDHDILDRETTFPEQAQKKIFLIMSILGLICLYLLFVINNLIVD